MSEVWEIDGIADATGVDDSRWSISLSRGPKTYDEFVEWLEGRAHE